MGDLRVSVTDRCNFRCPYCMPAQVYGERYKFLPRSEILSFEEIARLVRLFVDLGVNKVRLTGGEPLVRQGLEKLISMLAEILRCGRPDADHQRLPADKAGGGPQGCGPAANYRQPGQPG